MRFLSLCGISDGKNKQITAKYVCVCVCVGWWYVSGRIFHAVIVEPDERRREDGEKTCKIKLVFSFGGPGRGMTG